MESKTAAFGRERQFMSESIGIVCPVCRSKLRLKGSVLTKATVPCPKCGTTLDIPKTDTAVVSLPLSPPLKSPELAPKPTRPPISKSADETKRPVAALPSEAAPQKRKKPAEEIPDSYGGDTFDGDGDFFSGGSDASDSYGADAEPYESTTVLPSKKRAKANTSARSSEQVAASSNAGTVRRGGFLSWVGYGLLAAIVGIILQTLLGFTNYLFPLLIATVATGSMVGAAVRYAAGENDGWGPGIVAVLIAAFAIFAGRVGAFSVSPDVDKILGIPTAPETPEEAEARVIEETAEPFLVADIAEEVQYDEEFMRRENIDEDAASEYWLEHSEEVDPSKQYLPSVWTESTQRWNRNSQEQKENIRKNKELELRESYGIMSDESIKERIGQATTDEGMTAEIANTLYSDSEWITKSGLTENQIDEHWENTEFDGTAGTETQHLAPVWAEAKRRWEETPPDQKQARIKEKSDNLRTQLAFSDDAAQVAENVGQAIRVLVIIFGALFTMFWGIGSLICSISALAGAFKLGSGMATGKR